MAKSEAKKMVKVPTKKTTVVKKPVAKKTTTKKPVAKKEISESQIREIVSLLITDILTPSLNSFEKELNSKLLEICDKSVNVIISKYLSSFENDIVMECLILCGAEPEVSPIFETPFTPEEEFLIEEKTPASISTSTPSPTTLLSPEEEFLIEEKTSRREELDAMKIMDLRRIAKEKKLTLLKTNKKAEIIDMILKSEEESIEEDKPSIEETKSYPPPEPKKKTKKTAPKKYELIKNDDLNVWVDKETGKYVFDEKTESVFGKLNEDEDETIPLEPKDIKFLEKNKIPLYHQRKLGRRQDKPLTSEEIDKLLNEEEIPAESSSSGVGVVEVTTEGVTLEPSILPSEELSLKEFEEQYNPEDIPKIAISKTVFQKDEGVEDINDGEENGEEIISSWVVHEDIIDVGKRNIERLGLDQIKASFAEGIGEKFEKALMQVSGGEKPSISKPPSSKPSQPKPPQPQPSKPSQSKPSETQPSKPQPQSKIQTHIQTKKDEPQDVTEGEYRKIKEVLGKPSIDYAELETTGISKQKIAFVIKNMETFEKKYPPVVNAPKKLKKKVTIEE